MFDVLFWKNTVLSERGIRNFPFLKDNGHAVYKYKIIDSSMCPCKIGEQTADRILYDCELVKQERDKLKAEILRSENWPESKDTLINKYTKI